MTWALVGGGQALAAAGSPTPHRALLTREASAQEARARCRPLHLANFGGTSAIVAVRGVSCRTATRVARMWNAGHVKRRFVDGIHDQAHEIITVDGPWSCYFGMGQGGCGYGPGGPLLRNRAHYFEILELQGPNEP